MIRMARDTLAQIFVDTIIAHPGHSNQKAHGGGKGGSGKMTPEERSYSLNPHNTGTRGSGGQSPPGTPQPGTKRTSAANIRNTPIEGGGAALGTKINSITSHPDGSHTVRVGTKDGPLTRNSVSGGRSRTLGNVTGDKDGSVLRTLKTYGFDAEHTDGRRLSIRVYGTVPFTGRRT